MQDRLSGRLNRKSMKGTKDLKGSESVEASVHLTSTATVND
jgi:hypothetical protein